MTLLEAVRTGDRRTALVALRDAVAETIDAKDSARDIAALSKRLMEVMAEIDALPDPEDDASPLDAARNKRGA
ncbi:MAG TPA: hypothetical protein IAA15_02625 [Candidatus Olsenella pullicola]|nr:hypothetical protein [Candidatus Olsenella pullicola]